MLNNNLTRFDQGGTHESSPLGGIPQGMASNGQQNLVEQGETKVGNFVHSNRISLDGGLVKQFNLPTYIKGKTIADASKSIDDKFKDRADKYAQETKNTLLQRLGEAQEHVKAQEQAQLAQTNAAMQANSQEVPQSEGQIPQGMEEFAGDQVQPTPEQGGSGLPQSNQMIAAMGGYLPKRFDNGGMLNPFQDPNVNPNMFNAGPITPSFVQKNQVVSPESLPSTGMPSAGSMVGAAGTLMDLGNTAFGKASQDTSGAAASNHASGFGMIGGSAMKGASAGAALGPIGAGVGALVGAGAGLMGLSKERKAEAKNTANYAANINRSLSDNYAAYGGYLNQLAKGGGLSAEDRGSDKKPYPSVSSEDFAGGGRSYPIPTKADAVDALRLAGLHGRSDVRSKVFAKYPSLKHADGGPMGPQLSPQEIAMRSGTPGTISDIALTSDLANQFANRNIKPSYVPMQDATAALGTTPIPQSPPSSLTKVGKTLGTAGKAAGKFALENAGEAMRFAPIAMNAYQLANLGKTQGVNYATSGARFKPGYVDEAALQRTVDQEANNQIRGLQESGASEGAVRAATLAAGLNKTKALSDAYSQAAAANRATDVQGQQFNYAVDASNIATRNKALDETRMDEAARRSAKSKLLSSIGTDIGSVGKEISDAQLAGALTGYSRRGKYLIKPDGTKATPEETAQAAELYRKTQPSQTTTSGMKLKLGGYITHKPSKY